MERNTPKKSKQTEHQTYGYLRVSTDKQDVQNFKNWILNKANDLNAGRVIFVEETVTGKKPWQKRKLGELFATMNKGDTLITFEISRLGRDFRNTVSFISECDAKGIKIYAGDIQTADTSIESNMKIFMSAMTSQQEREAISRRTREALARKKAAGVKLGRPTSSTKLAAADPDVSAKIQADVSNGLKLYAIAKKYNISRETLRKYMRANNITAEHCQA